MNLLQQAARHVMEIEQRLRAGQPPAQRAERYEADVRVLLGTIMALVNETDAAKRRIVELEAEVARLRGS